MVRQKCSTKVVTLASWDIDGMTLLDFLRPCKTMIGAENCSKRYVKLAKRILILLDDALVHESCKCCKNGFEFID